VRAQLPEEWSVLILLPEGGPGLHSKAERRGFERLTGTGTALNDTLCRLVFLGMLPAGQAGDRRSFCRALYDFHPPRGALFAASQGGRYATSGSAELVRSLRDWGIPGVGQSSWGPAVFAVCPSRQQASDVVGRVRERHGDAVRTWVTRPSRGAIITTA